MHALRLSDELRKRGYEAAICGPHGSVVTHSDCDVPIFHVEIPRSPDLLRHPAAVFRIGAIFRRFAPDVVHAHGSQGGVAARLARAFRPATPVVFTPHNFAFTNYFPSRSRRALYEAIERGLAPLANRVLCVCEAEARTAARIYPPSRIRVVHNGIEPLTQASVSTTVRELAGTEKLVAVVAELQAPKGVTSAIAAMPVLLEQHPTAQLAVAGDGIECEALRRQIHDLDVAANVHLLGSLDSESVAGLIEAAAVVLQPSWSESLPYSILEAMSLAAPIVATDVGGVGEAIEDGVTGRLVGAKDPVAIAGAVGDLLGNRELAARLAATARERQRKLFTLERMVAGTLDVYREVGL